jgi:hypothetical protein
MVERIDAPKAPSSKTATIVPTCRGPGELKNCLK